jgi:hypothetical protein
MARRTLPTNAKSAKVRGLSAGTRPERKASAAHVVSRSPFVLYFSLMGGLSTFHATDEGVAPSLRVQPLISGLQGIIERKEGDFDLDGLLVNCRETNTYVLPDWEEYCVPFEGGYVPAHVLDDRGRLRSPAEAAAAYNAWLWALAEDGQILSPLIEDVDAVIADLSTLIGRFRVEYRVQIAQGEAIGELDILARRLAAAQKQAAAMRGAPQEA